MDDDASVGLAIPENEGDDSSRNDGNANSSASDDGFSTMTGDSVGGEGPDAGAGIDIDITDSDGPDLRSGDDLGSGGEG